MKFYHIYIILSLILLVKNINFCELTIPANKPDDCKDLLKGSYVNYCCYFKGKWNGVDYSGCIDITPIRLYEMKDYIEEMNKDPKFNIEKIDCESLFLKMSLIYIVLFLI